MVLLAGTYSSAGETSFAVARFHIDGRSDLTFGPNGIRTANLGTGESAAGMAVDHLGRVIVAGSVTNSTNSSEDIGLARFVMPTTTLASVVVNNAAPSASGAALAPSRVRCVPTSDSRTSSWH